MGIENRPSFVAKRFCGECGTTASQSSTPTCWLADIAIELAGSVKAGNLSVVAAKRRLSTKSQIANRERGCPNISRVFEEIGPQIDPLLAKRRRIAISPSSTDAAKEYFRQRHNRNPKR